MTAPAGVSLSSESTRKEGIHMDTNRKKNQTYEEWYVRNAKPGYSIRRPQLMYSETIAEDAARIVDRGYFIAFLTPEESKSGQAMVATYRETTVYDREANGDPGRVLHSETVVIGSLKSAQ